MPHSLRARSVALLAALTLVAATSGCARMFGGSTQRLTVTSDPPGARVFIAGADSGVTPRVLRIKREFRPLELRVQGSGAAADTRTIGRELSVWGAFFDLLLMGNGALAWQASNTAGIMGTLFYAGLGFGVDGFTGSIWLLQTDSVHVRLPTAAAKP